MATEDAENRFKHLLQPIRDLAANWDVDIASALEGYLEDLDSITIQLHDGSTNLNFAQAALLIQGSTCVYSKKVEYLHALVYQTLELITAQKRAGTKGKNAENETQEEEVAWDADPKMLILDDVVEEGQDIDLVLTAKERQSRRSSFMMGRTRHSNSTDITRASMVLMHSILHEDHGNFSLKVNSCSIDDNGALVLPGAMSAAKRRNSEQMFQPVNADHDDVDDGPMDDYGPVFDDSVDFPAPHEGPAGPAAAGDEMYGEGNAQAMFPGTPKKGISFADDADLHGGDEEETDPWAPLDPHTADNVKPRPARKGRTYRIPASLRQQPAGQEAVQHGSSDIAATELLLNRHKLGYQGIKLKGSLFPEFAQYLKHLRKRQLQDRIKQSKQRAAAAAASQRARHGAGADHVFGASTNAAGHFDDGDDGDDDMYFGDNDDGYADNDFGPLAGGLGGGVDGEDMGAHDEEVSNAFADAFKEASQTYEDLCKRHIENFMQGVDKYARETQLTKRVADWQQKLEPLLEEQENREPFDIHVYGDRILNKLVKNKKKQQKGAPVPFEDVAGHLSQFEVCRLFLASLQLANMGNVELQHSSGEDQHLGMRLLTAAKGVDIDRYMAPSLTEGVC